MTQAQTKPKRIGFDEFIAWYPENSELRYELHDGVIIEMPKPTGKHSNLAGSLIEQLLINIRQLRSGQQLSLVRPIPPRMFLSWL